MKKLIILALICAFLVSCGPSNQYQIMYDNGEIVWADNDIRLEASSGDSVIVENVVGLYPGGSYHNQKIWGLYKGTLPEESVYIDSKGDRRSRTWYKTAMIYK